MTHTAWCIAPATVRYSCECGATLIGICRNCGHPMWQKLVRPGRRRCAHMIQLGPPSGYAGEDE